MPKKIVPKTKVPSKKVVHKKTPSQKNPNVDKILAENFIALQKVMTHLAVKFDNLSIQISKLLELFEISAKTLAKKDVTIDMGKGDPKIAEKLDNLLGQNKIIARSLTLLHGSPEPSSPQQFMGQQIPNQIPPSTPQPLPPKQTINASGYQKSMSTKNQESEGTRPQR